MEQENDALSKENATTKKGSLPSMVMRIQNGKAKAMHNIVIHSAPLRSANHPAIGVAVQQKNGRNVPIDVSRYYLQNKAGTTAAMKMRPTPDESRPQTS